MKSFIISTFSFFLFAGNFYSLSGDEMKKEFQIKYNQVNDSIKDQKFILREMSMRSAYYMAVIDSIEFGNRLDSIKKLEKK